MIFLYTELATLLFFRRKSCCIGVFFVSFSVIFSEKSKKIWQFFAIFSRCVSTSYDKFEKKIGQKT